MRIVAHRGARADEPENTLRALERAAECGADLVEVDIRQSKDHKLVVIHDATLEQRPTALARSQPRHFSSSSDWTRAWESVFHSYPKSFLSSVTGESVW